MGDPIADRFSDLASSERFAVPGKKAPVNRTAEKAAAIESQMKWDERPLTYMHGGVEREFFTISHLATAVGKSVVTIRSWENKGLLPKSPYRSPRPRKETIPGRTPKGKRLWTRDQINGILRIAAEEKVILNGKPPTETFAKKVTILFKTLLEKEQAR